MLREKSKHRWGRYDFLLCGDDFCSFTSSFYSRPKGLTSWQANSFSEFSVTVKCQRFAKESKMTCYECVFTYNINTVTSLAGTFLWLHNIYPSTSSAHFYVWTLKTTSSTSLTKLCIFTGFEHFMAITETGMTFRCPNTAASTINGVWKKQSWQIALFSTFSGSFWSKGSSGSHSGGLRSFRFIF